MTPEAEFLVEHVMESYEASRKTNEILQQLLVNVDNDLVDMGVDRAKKDKWGKSYARDGTPADIIRVGTVDLETLRSLLPSGADPRRSDGGGRLPSSYGDRPVPARQERAAAPPDYFGRKIRKYVERVLSTELAPIAAFAQKVADAGGGQRHAVVAVDWYRDRSTDTHVLHKDTVGTTLFVALHYANKAPILGAEYIFDQWRMLHTTVPSTNPNKWSRSNAPWSPDLKSWSETLCTDLELARKFISEKIQGPGDVMCVPLEPYGLISFVDELLWHATPLEGSRTRLEDQGRTLYRMASIQGIDKNLPVNTPRLVRQVSKSKLEELPIRDEGKRRFLRLWICVQPRAWTIQA